MGCNTLTKSNRSHMVFAKKTIVSLLVTAALISGVASFAEEGDLMLMDKVSSHFKIVRLGFGFLVYWYSCATAVVQ